MQKGIFTNSNNILKEVEFLSSCNTRDVNTSIKPNIKYQKHLGFGGALKNEYYDLYASYLLKSENY